MATTPSTYMSMPIPGVATEPGPLFATDLNNCLNIVDMHDHTSGLGVPITPSGMNINAALTFANNQLTNAQFLGMYLQTADPSALGCLYYKGVDLYFNDGSSNHIRMTASGSVSGSTGTITGLPSGTASASYQAGSGTFVFQSATNTGADLDGRSLVLRNSSASSHSLTISPPAAMGSDIAMTMPTIPASTQAMNMTSGGAMGTITYDAIGQAMTSTGANAIAASRTRTSGSTVAAGGVASSSTVNFSTSSTVAVDVTNVTITTSGRPVRLELVSVDTTGTSSGILVNNATLTFALGWINFLSGSSIISSNPIGNYSGATHVTTVQLFLPASSFAYTDLSVNGVAGTVTYKVQALVINGSTSLSFINTKLIAYEL